MGSPGCAARDAGRLGLDLEQHPSSVLPGGVGGLRGAHGLGPELWGHAEAPSGERCLG